MSAGWRITRGEQQLAARDVAELKLMGLSGKIQPGDLIQEPGGTSWRYAAEVPELMGVIKAAKVDEGDIPKAAGAGRGVARIMLFFWGVTVVVGGFGGLVWMWLTPPELLVADKAVALRRTTLSSRVGIEDPDGKRIDQFDLLELVGAKRGHFQVKAPDGTTGWLKAADIVPVPIAPMEGMATQYSDLLAQPDSNAATIGEVKANEVVELLERKGDFYLVKSLGGDGWLGSSQVLPGYMFHYALKERYDPKFNPSAYVEIVNGAWTPSGEPGQAKTMTNMLLHVANPTAYGMTGVVLRITFYDGEDKLIATKDFEVPRLLPPADSLHLDPIDIDIEWREGGRAVLKVRGAVALSVAEYSRMKAEEEVRLAAEASEAAK